MFRQRKFQISSAQRLLRERADAARDARDWRLAAALYEIHLGTPPHDGEAALWVQLGHCRKEAGNLDGALQAYRRSLDLAPDRAETHLQTGHLHKVAGRPDHAATSYAAALRLDPGCDDAREELSGLSRAEEDDGNTGSSASDMLQSADAARDRSRWSEAAMLYAGYLATDPAAADARAAWVQLGHARKEGGDRDGAVLAYETALALDPTDAETHVHLAHLHKAMGATGAAVESLTEALRLAPQSDAIERDLRDLAAAAACPAVRRSPAAEQGAIRHALPLPWTGDRSPFQSPFPPVHMALVRRFGCRDAGPA